MNSLFGWFSRNKRLIFINKPKMEMFHTEGMKHPNNLRANYFTRTIEIQFTNTIN